MNEKEWIELIIEYIKDAKLIKGIQRIIFEYSDGSVVEFLPKEL